MDIQGRLDTLINYIRQSRKRISASAFFVALVALILFITGSYYFLFYYYEKIIQQYYDSLLRNVSIYQHGIIRKGTYWDDVGNICTSLKTNKGVIDVWCTDRFGKLIYHTNENFYDEYKSKRLPSDYYESITYTWEFQDGLPIVNRQQPHNLILYRLSIPIYAFGGEAHDFILGMDVERFVFLPEKTSRILVFIIGYVVVSIIVLYIPLFLWFRSRFTKMISQTRLVVGTIQMDTEKVTPRSADYEREARVPVPIETDHGEAEISYVEEEKAEREEIIQVEEEPRPVQVAEEEAYEEVTAPEERFSEPEPAETKERAAAVEMIEEKLRTNPIMLLMDKKGSLFRSQDIDLDFIQASSSVYHSKSSSGSYVFYYQNEGYYLFTIFSYPDVNPQFAADQLTTITEYFRSWAGSEPDIRNIFKTLNTYCLENNLHVDASTVLIKEQDKKVEYSSCGKGQAFYVKKGEDVVKDLNLGIDGLGRISDVQFEEVFSYAEIDFEEEDIFILLPQNSTDIIIEGESLYNLIKRVVLERKQSNAHEVVAEIHDRFEEFRKKERKIPETGFAIFKFL